jgi:ABC-2 type transport system permease protein
MKQRLWRVRALARKEMVQLLRDARTRALIFVAPIVQLLVFGYAVRTDIPNTPFAVLDQDHSIESRALIDAFTTTGYFRLVAAPARSGDLAGALDDGDATVALEIPAGFSRDLTRAGGAAVQLLVDGTQSNTATVALGYANRIVAAFAAARAAPTGGGVIDLRSRAWFNPALESRLYNVPGVIALLILLMCLTLTALAIVREREFGTLDQLLVTPLQAGEFLVGKTLPVVLIAFVDLALISGLAVVWFQIPFRGSVLVLLPAALLYIITGIALGLLISSISQTQQEAFMTMFLFLLPSIILSGFFYPISSMPRLFQWITVVNPVRHFLMVVRSVFLKGAGLGGLWPQMGALALIGAGTMGLALWRLRRATPGSH